MDDQHLTPATRVRQSKWEVDARRARALHADPLEELTEKQRDWIWRSLLKGVRLKEATRLAQLTPQEVTQALDRVARAYTASLAQQRALRAPSAGTPAGGRRPQAPLAAPSPDDPQSPGAESRPPGRRGELPARSAERPPQGK